MPLAHLTRPYIVPELKCNVLNTILLNMILTGQFCVNTILVKVFPSTTSLLSFFLIFIWLLGLGLWHGIFHCSVWCHEFTCPMACGILIFWAGIEPVSLTTGRQIYNHWTTREVSEFLFESCLPYMSYFKLHWLI